MVAVVAVDVAGDDAAACKTLIGGCTVDVNKDNGVTDFAMDEGEDSTGAAGRNDNEAGETESASESSFMLLRSSCK